MESTVLRRFESEKWLLSPGLEFFENRYRQGDRETGKKASSKRAAPFISFILTALFLMPGCAAYERNMGR